MSADTINHTEIGLSRVALQYQESPKFLAWLRALLAYSDEIETLFQKMALQVDIDQAEGVNLDVIGVIVGRSRIIESSIPVGFFGFEDQPGVLSYGEEGFPGIGGRFRDETEPAFASSVLADPEYRLLLKAKIIKNHSHGYTEEVLDGLSTLIPGAPVVADDNGLMLMQVGIGRELRFWEQVLIKEEDLLSRPAGVLINSYTHWDGSAYFGFEGQPGALGFGEEGNPAIGGKLAEEF
ncbi:DUF2612 domain-containing protein [Hydrogenophaga pseudoflava]|uniref:DUF2612 domain-containing protein n=1 Tax=Hydrogenophaga pseudoflava TaxID=47421 RepID=UPI0027E551CB|nr:DUF2612 domain-containing protein [Hydrogenophaga pseudoflava]MDQ7745457.1 DUF2612 domain-containing protein [Hydrogenophaga pseudoflava]